jgi:hypothetical protein
VRERTEIQRGWKAVDAPFYVRQRLYYNFIRENQGLEGLTPAEMAGFYQASEETDGWNCSRKRLRRTRLVSRNSRILVSTKTMNERSKRGFGLAGAMIIAALIISASVVFAASRYGLGATRTATSTETSTIAPRSIPLYKVTFNESGACGAFMSISGQSR